MDNGLYFITFILTLISGISAYYYLSMIKNIFFIKTLTTDLELINKPS
jgi:NADH:ubiquinone oxidoreductase subunit 2 (subunit N)